MARVAAILDIFFMVINILTVTNWLATRLVSSDGFVKTILKQARAVDKKGSGCQRGPRSCSCLDYVKMEWRHYCWELL